VSTGGTGFTPRDVTPEAVQPLLRRTMDGFSVVFHQASLGTVGISTMQSRAFAGQIEDTFIFCLPGSTGACKDGWDLVLVHEFDSRYRPCSIAGLVPRLRALRLMALIGYDEALALLSAGSNRSRVRRLPWRRRRDAFLPRL
jgi:molybdenum cofactor biosynthesis protein B